MCLSYIRRTVVSFSFAHCAIFREDGTHSFHGHNAGRRRRMFAWLFQTDQSVVGLLLRLRLAVVIFPHGAQKVLGWFGGQGFTPTLQFFTSAGIPPALALLAMAAEFLGSLGLVIGLLTRLAA